MRSTEGHAFSALEWLETDPFAAVRVICLNSLNDDDDEISPNSPREIFFFYLIWDLLYIIKFLGFSFVPKFTYFDNFES